ncbi:hypothetical protein MC7420_3961 [Coleofasciculus chthonoplastes PCC 7420]|uniref:Uncharacterized protein n=1 Tax=Coleofasciculus chthonoplastes PCC 7420 TaxID=118168 RepID=B4VUE6_9CYAN|nr:hypothetical protein MC7420_3961 [Coleofasciculus chthonoplastes PCC 7420]
MKPGVFSALRQSEVGMNGTHISRRVGIAHQPKFQHHLA